MTRTKAFEQTDVIEKAMILFWKQGYEATSMQDLVDTMGINRGSIYDTFDSKHRLFHKTLDHYRCTVVNPKLQELDESDDPIASIESFFRKLTSSRRMFARYGCFMTNSGLELACLDRKTALKVRNGLQQIEDTFYRALVRAKKQGYPLKTGPRVLARVLVNTLQGLRVTTKAKCSKRFVDDIVRITLSLV